MSSIVHIVKVTGKNRAELIKALQGALRELGGDEVPASATDFYAEATHDPELHSHGTEADEEMEPVASPFGNVAPIMGNVPSATPVKASPSSDASGEGVDSEGLPWDKRIHASSKEKIANGTWRKRRGIDDETYFKVKQELRGQAPVQSASIQVPNQPTHAMQTPAVPQSAPVAPPMPMQNMNGGHTLQTFQANFAHTLSALITEGKLTQDYVQGLAVHFGIPQIWMASLEQQEVMFNEFAKYGIITKVG